jgi:hypothetical protein
MKNYDRCNTCNHVRLEHTHDNLDGDGTGCMHKIKADVEWHYCECHYFIDKPPEEWKNLLRAAKRVKK